MKPQLFLFDIDKYIRKFQHREGKHKKLSIIKQTLDTIGREEKKNNKRNHNSLRNSLISRVPSPFQNVSLSFLKEFKDPLGRLPSKFLQVYHLVTFLHKSSRPLSKH